MRRNREGWREGEGRFRGGNEREGEVGKFVGSMDIRKEGKKEEWKKGSWREGGREGEWAWRWVAGGCGEGGASSRSDH